jgi:hypothetical protein
MFPLALSHVLGTLAILSAYQAVTGRLPIAASYLRLDL